MTQEPEVIVEDPPVSPAPLPPDPVKPVDPNLPPDQEAEDLDTLLAQIAEKEAILAEVNKKLANCKTDLERDKQKLAALGCPYRIGDVIHLSRSRFTTGCVMSILAPCGPLHEHKGGEFSLSIRGIKSDGNFSDVIWTVHNYQLEGVVDKKSPPEPVIDPILDAVFMPLIAVAQGWAVERLKVLRRGANAFTIDGVHVDVTVCASSVSAEPGGMTHYTFVDGAEVLAILRKNTTDMVVRQILLQLITNWDAYFRTAGVIIDIKETPAEPEIPVEPEP